MTENHFEYINFKMEQLLREVCMFLDEEISRNYMSDESRDKAKLLIAQSKMQLIALSNPVSNTDAIPGYIDMMHGTGAVISEYVPPDLKEKPSTIYSAPNLNDAIAHASTSASTDRVCPYINWPASSISDEIQTGYLYRKERTFFFEQSKKVFVAIEGDWMLIYNGKKDAKPNQVLDLNEYEARPSINTSKEHNKKVEESFVLTHMRTSKSYQFTAPTHADLINWVKSINVRNKMDIAPKPLVYEFINEMSLADDETYDIVRPPCEESPTVLAQQSSAMERTPKNGKLSARPLPKIPSDDCIYNSFVFKAGIDPDEAEICETYDEPLSPTHQSTNQANSIFHCNTYDILETEVSPKPFKLNENHLWKSLTPNKSRLFALMGRKRDANL